MVISPGYGNGIRSFDLLPVYLNQDLERLAEWLEDNNLFLNVAKTKSLLFTAQRHKERDCKLSNSSRKGNILRDYLQIFRCRI